MEISERDFEKAGHSGNSLLFWLVNKGYVKLIWKRVGYGDSVLGVTTLGEHGGVVQKIRNYELVQAHLFNTPVGKKIQTENFIEYEIHI